jgi:glutamine amidotransferase
MSKTIAIIDTGSGNIRSAVKAFEHVCRNEVLDYDIALTDKPEDVLRAERIVLPGQGAFGDVMDGLMAADGLYEALEEAVLHKATPYLGICVGMQMLVERGFEHGEHKGLGWIEGECAPITPADKTLKIPHMGWNALVFNGGEEVGEQDNRHFVLRSTSYSNYSYFVHSFMVQCKDKQNILADCDYGGLFPAVIGRDNIIGVQFHPEKSQRAGLQMVSDFIHWKP